MFQKILIKWKVEIGLKAYPSVLQMSSVLDTPLNLCRFASFPINRNIFNNYISTFFSISEDSYLLVANLGPQEMESGEK
jgi:hypothetical protein